MASKGSKPVFLDVDSSIVENNLRFASDPNEDELNKLFPLGGHTPPSKLIKPTPGFCVKTREVGTDTKVFVNICHNNAIPPPKDITAEELEAILQTDEAVDYRVPMSLGEIRTDKDKKGENAKACDVVVHPSFFTKVETMQPFKNFFMAVVFQGLENKYGLTCVDEKIILMNRKAFGTLQMHRIQQREIDEKMGKDPDRSLLEEVTGGKTDAKKPLIETIANIENKPREPEYRLFKRKGGPNCLIGEFKMPDILSAKELTLDIGEDRILLESKTKGYLVDIFVPYIVRQDFCSSSFEKTTKILTVTMPLKGG